MPIGLRRLATATSLALFASLGGCQKRDRPATVAPADALAVTPAAESLEVPSRPFDYRTSELANGLRVVTLEDHSSPIAAVQLWYHVGSKDERPDRRGFAHMFEHMMFRGTQNIGPKAHFEHVRKVGGDANAYTSFDNTTYVQVVPSNQVEMVLWLEAERMGFLKINQGYFDTERKVVAEEFRMGREQPYGTAVEKLLPQIFGKHPYAWSPIGNMDELAAAKADELQQFWNTFYIPNNAALVVVGDVEHEAVEKLAERYFGWIPRYPDPPRVTVREPAQTEKKKIVIQERNGPVPIVALGFRTVGLGDRDELALQALATVLGGGESSRLYRRMVTDERKAMFALGMAFSLEQDGLFAAGAVLKPLVGKPDAALQIIHEEIAKLRKDGPTDEEVAKAKAGMLRDATLGLLTIESKARRLGAAAVLEGDVENANRDFAEIAALTRADLARVAKERLVENREIEVRIEPNLIGFLADQLSGDKPKADDRPAKGAEKISGEGSGKPGLVRPAELAAAPPVARALDSVVTTNTVERTLANGLRVVVLENHEVPYVEMRLGLEYGAFSDPAETPGVAFLALPMLTRGTTKHNYKQLTDVLDRHAISINGGATMDSAAVTATAVRREAARAAELLAEVVLQPAFVADELERHVDQVTTGLMVTERSPEYIADRELRKRIFGNHPYARLPESKAADLHKVKAETLKTWWSTHARPDAAVLYIAGDITAERAFELAQAEFGAWKAVGTKPAITIGAPAPTSAPQIVLVDRAGNQSQIRVGRVGIGRTDPDFAGARVLSEVFGGGFNSRLNDTIRVKKGLTYGAGGGFSADRFGGRFVVRTFSKNATVGETVAAIIDETAKLSRRPPDQGERDAAVSFIVGSHPRERETVGEMIDELWMLQTNGLPKNWYTSYLQAVRTADTAGIASVAKRLVDSKNLVIVVVGPAKELEPQLRRFGKVEIVKP